MNELAALPFRFLSLLLGDIDSYKRIFLHKNWRSNAIIILGLYNIISNIVDHHKYYEIPREQSIMLTMMIITLLCTILIVKFIKCKCSVGTI